MSETRMFVFKSIVRRKVISKGVFHHNWNFDPTISVIVVEMQIFSLHLIKLEILLISKLLVSFCIHRGNDPAALSPEECGCITEDLQQVGQALNQQQADMQGCHQFGGTVRCKIRYSFISLGIQKVATRKR